MNYNLIQEKESTESVRVWSSQSGINLPMMYICWTFILKHGKV